MSTSEYERDYRDLTGYDTKEQRVAKVSSVGKEVVIETFDSKDRRRKFPDIQTARKSVRRAASRGRVAIFGSLGAGAGAVVWDMSRILNGIAERNFENGKLTVVLGVAGASLITNSVQRMRRGLTPFEAEEALGKFDPKSSKLKK